MPDVEQTEIERLLDDIGLENNQAVFDVHGADGQESLSELLLFSAIYQPYVYPLHENLHIVEEAVDYVSKVPAVLPQVLLYLFLVLFGYLLLGG